MLNLNQLLFQLFTVDSIVVLSCLQPWQHDHRIITRRNSRYSTVGLRRKWLNLKFSSCRVSSCCCNWLCFLPDGVLGSSNVSSWLARSVRTSFSANKLFCSSCSTATCANKKNISNNRYSDIGVWNEWTQTQQSSGYLGCFFLFSHAKQKRPSSTPGCEKNCWISTCLKQKCVNRQLVSYYYHLHFPTVLKKT